MIINVAICDDDTSEQRLASDLIRRSLTKYGENFTISIYDSGKRLIESMRDSRRFDIILLDILMPMPGGIETAKIIRQMDEDCYLLFLTSSRDYALDSYEVNAFHYFTKPPNEQRFDKIMRQIICLLRQNDRQKIALRSSASIVTMKYRDIMYIESIKHTLSVTLADGSVKSFYYSLREFYDKISSDSRFILPHRAFIVNMDYVSSLTERDFILSNGARIPISKNNYYPIKRRYLQYLFTDKERD